MIGELEVRDLVLQLVAVLEPSESPRVQLTAMADEVRAQCRWWRGTPAEQPLRDLAVALDHLSSDLESA